MFAKETVPEHLKNEGLWNSQKGIWHGFDESWCQLKPNVEECSLEFKHVPPPSL